MIKGFDLVVDIQICMMIVIFVLSIRYALAEERTLTSYSIMPALYSVWSGILLYYFSHFFLSGITLVSARSFPYRWHGCVFPALDLISLLSAQQKTGILSADILLAFQSPSCYHYLLGHSRSGISVSVHRGFVGLQ